MQHNFSKTILASLILSSLTGVVYAENNNEKNAVNTETAKLETIVVSASGFEQNIKKAAATISVLSQEDINKAKTNNFSNITYEELFHNIKLAIGQYIVSAINLVNINLSDDYPLKYP